MEPIIPADLLLISWMICIKLPTSDNLFFG